MEKEEENKRLSCCERLRAEWGLSLFDTREFNGRLVDLNRTFRPQPLIGFIITKVVFLAWSLAIMSTDIITNQEAGAGYFFMAYLTNWGTVGVSLYFVLNISVAMFPIQQANPSILVKATWALFSTIAPCELLITLLYWTLVFGGDGFRYLDFMAHGGLMILVWIDGFLINRIPIRVKHIFFFYFFAILYGIWSGIHAAVDMGNPRSNKNDLDSDDDAIYSTLNWNERPIATLIVFLLVCLIVIPLLFFFAWSVSAYGGGCRFNGGLRRCLGEDENYDRGKEESSVDIEASGTST